MYRPLYKAPLRSEVFRCSYNPSRIRERLYREYKYKLIARTDFDFTLNPNLSDDLKKLYLPTILYLKLKNRQKVNLKNLQEYFPNYTKQMHSKTLKYMRNTIGEDLYKDEYKSYVIEEIE